jgi:hypothetical protein
MTRGIAILLAVTLGSTEALAFEPEPEPDPESESESESDSDSDSESESDSASDPDPDPDPDPAPDPAPVPAPEMPIPATSAEPGTLVTFHGGSPDTNLELFRLDPNAESEAVGRFDGIPYTRVCTDPCERRVELRADDQLFVAGPRLMPSKTFTLDTAANELDLHVRPGPKPIRFAGFGLTVSGAILIPGGGLIVGAIDRGRGPEIAGYTLIGVGVAALAVGIALLIRGRTLVRANAH